MPSRNTVKNFAAKSYYHIYNRGVEKKRIFEDAQDYQKFLYYLKTYLTPINILHQENPLMRKNLVKNNLSEDVKLLTYCLMPNHFHLLLYQETETGITKLMRQVTTAYSMFFNKKYDRIGPLFQGIYKAVHVPSESQLVGLSHFIHTNPLERDIDLEDFTWSSFQSYTGKDTPPWLEKDIILQAFKQQFPEKNYLDFVKKQQEVSQDIRHLLIDE